jgi:hypothetical protein
MSADTIRPAYSSWPGYNRRFRDVVVSLSEEQLSLRPTPERCPLWASIGHTACQRVFWLCVFAGEPGAETTPFRDSGNVCPGDEDLEHVLSAKELGDALDSTFLIIERCLDRWTLDMLDEVIRRPEWDESWVHARARGDPAREHARRLPLRRAQRVPWRGRSAADQSVGLGVSDS